MGTTLHRTDINPPQKDEPELVVAFGATNNKRRALTKTTTVIGRSHICDIRLEAPEIAPMHCIVSRDNDAISIRDCDSRTGVIVNGQPIRDAHLNDGDTIQLGPFTFIVHLPSDSDERSDATQGPPDQATEQHNRLQEALDEAKAFQNHISNVEAERDKLAGQVHELRQQIEAESANPRLAEELSNVHADLSKLRGDYDTLILERDQLRCALDSASNASNEQELSVLKDRVQKLEQELQSARDERERALAESAAAIEQSHALEEQLAALRQELTTLQQQAESVLRERDEQRAQLDQLQDERQQFEQERQRLQAELDAAVSNTAEPDSEATQQQSRELQELKAALQQSERKRLDIERHLEAEHEQNEKRLATLRQELDRERMQLKQLVIQAAAQHNQTQTEIESLRGQLSGQKPGEILSPEDEASELDALRQRVRELEHRIDTGGADIPPDLAQYEADLHKFRDDLERAQEDIAQREQELEIQKGQTFEKLKQTELELSRERAAVARERAEIERLRREFQAEMEHAEREAQTRARLAPIDKLANEMRGQAHDETANASSLSQRLGNLIRRVQGNG